MAKKKHALIVAEDDVQLYKVVGINSTLKDYRLVWNINNLLSTNFKRLDDFDSAILHKKQVEKFPLYYFFEKNTLKEYFLVGNKKQQSLLFEKQKLMDFLLFIKGEQIEEYTLQIIKTMRTIQQVQVVNELKINDIKEFEAFTQELELIIIELNKKEKQKKYGNKPISKNARNTIHR